MLSRRVKAGVLVVALVVALVVLVVEGFFVYRWYDRYVWSDAASGDVSVRAPASEGTTAGGTTSEGTTAEGTTAEGTTAEGTTAEGTTAEGTTAEGGAPSGAEDIALVHRATEGNSRGDYTYLGDPRIDGDSDAIVLAEPSAGREGNGDPAYAHNIGVWYEPGAERWAVFNQDRAPVQAGAAFEVSVLEGLGGVVHRAEPANTVGNATYLDDPLVNGEPDVAVSVTQNWNPGGGEGVYNDHPASAFYDQDVGKWAVYNEDGAPMPEGAAFNVAVSGGAQAAG